MVKKNKSESPKIEIKKRVPKEKPNFFQNLTPFPKPNAHPLSEIMKLPFHEEDNISSNTINQEGAEQLTNQSILVNQENTDQLTETQILANQPSAERLTETLYIVNHDNEDRLTKDLEIVNQIQESQLTEIREVVNKPTKTMSRLTQNPKNQEGMVNKLTEPEHLVNQNFEEKYNWKSSERKRSKNLSVVEGFRTSNDFKKKVKEFCAKYEIDKQDFYRNAGEVYMSSFVNQENDASVNKLTLDDRRMRLLWKTKPVLINLYLRYNLILNPNSRWSANDDDAACKFNECDIRLIELGIIQTQANKKFSGKIGSFGYYANEIQNFIELNLPSESIGMMLEINRKRWTQATGRELDLKFLDEEQN